MCEPHHDLDTSSSGSAAHLTSPDRDRDAKSNQSPILNQTQNMAKANDNDIQSSDALQASLLCVSPGGFGGEAAAVSMRSNDAQKSTVRASIFGGGFTPAETRYQMREASLTDASIPTPSTLLDAMSNDVPTAQLSLCGPDDTQITLPSTSVAVPENETALQRDWKRLPREIRDIIWGYVDGPRIIEFERSPQHRRTGWMHIDHAAYQVTQNSRELPLCFRICSESFQAGIRRYKPLKFGSRDFACKIWFNVEDDIIWFGGHACARTLKEFLDDEGRVEIKNVAFSCNLGVDQCCAYDLGESCFLQMLQGHTEADEARDLHDQDDLLRGLRGQRWLKGCPGLKHIYIVVSSRLCGNFGRPGQMRPDVGFRPASSNGLNRKQQWYRQKQERDIDQVNRGKGVHLTRETTWVGDDKPTFHFVSFAPQIVDGKSYDAVTVDFEACEYLCRENRAFIEDLWRKFGVSIRVTERNSKDKDQQEIGISGPWESVKLAKKAIKTHVDKGIGRYVETNNKGTLYHFYERCEDGFKESTARRL